jgi:hypothetical protein
MRATVRATRLSTARANILDDWMIGPMLFLNICQKAKAQMFRVMPSAGGLIMSIRHAKA